MAFPHLPGVTVNLNDLGLKISPPPVRPRVTLMGITSNLDIPLREPFVVTNAGLAASSLYFSGSSGDPYPGELALALEEALDAGATAVEILVIGHYSGAALETYISPTGAGANSRYADLTLAYESVRHADLEVIVPLGAWADSVATTGLFTTQLANFCFQAASEIGNAAIGVLPMMPPVHWALTHRATLTGGLGDANLIAEINSIDPADGDLEFGSPSTALVTEWYKYASQTESPTVSATVPAVFSGYLAGSESELGVFSPTDDENAATAVNSTYWTYFQAVDSNGDDAFDLQGNRVDAGKRIAITTGPLVTTNSQVKALARGKGAALSNTLYNTDGAAAYGGMITSLAVQSATTNKLFSSISARKPLSGAQANALIGRRLTCFYQRPKGFVVASGVTGAHNVSKYVRSDYVRLSTIRIVDAVIELVREIGDRFIGEPNTAPSRNALGAEIDKGLHAMKGVRALQDYEFFVSASPEEEVLGEANVDLTLVPAFELIKINVSVSLSAQL